MNICVAQDAHGAWKGQADTYEPLAKSRPERVCCRTTSDLPSHQELIAARDAVAAQHPTLRVVGAHLGSLEYDVDEIARRFDQHPNFVVDISARLTDFALQDTAKVRRFCIQYQERILWGT